MKELEARETELLAAHQIRDLARLVELYAERAVEVEAEDLDAACFYMTNAYVFALELGAPAGEMHAFLLKYGREEGAGVQVKILK